jgi:alkyl sulfatase BDS1-like metallo-beta-lactamase superfamily hydrolase
VRLTHPALLALIGGQLSPQQLKVDGDRASLGRFFSLLEAPDRGFAIVTP